MRALYTHYINNPIWRIINEYFKEINIHYHNVKKNNDKINEIKSGEDWKDLGIPSLFLYELIKL